MTDREKLIELIYRAHHNASCVIAHDGSEEEAIEEEARYLLANGVTFATDTKVGDKWTPTDERLPDEFVSVLGHMTDAGEFPAVRECHVVETEFFFPALRECHPVDKWMTMPE
jgi:hypothetical protein